jgi:hypothetical protein
VEAFSDSVIAIIFIIMVLELRPPSQSTWPALLTAPIFLSYGLSFLVLADHVGESSPPDPCGASSDPSPPVVES